ncbi:hypothetical protein PFISCL1PPCAC_3071, partial [Pristionchus fissidentatus]
QTPQANAIAIKGVVIDCCIHEQWSAQKQCNISCSLYGGAGKCAQWCNRDHVPTTEGKHPHNSHHGAEVHLL